MSFAALASAFLADPSEERLTALRSAILRMRIYSPPLNGSAPDALLAEGRHAEAIAQVHTSIPLSFLSPAAHRSYAAALRGIGRHADADREDEMAEVILQALLRSGEGTPGRPYLILDEGDQDDIMRGLGLSITARRVDVRGVKMYDVLTGDDGSETWFEFFRDDCL